MYAPIVCSYCTEDGLEDKARPTHTSGSLVRSQTRVLSRFIADTRAALPLEHKPHVDRTLWGTRHDWDARTSRTPSDIPFDALAARLAGAVALLDDRLAADEFATQAAVEALMSGAAALPATLLFEAVLRLLVAVVAVLADASAPAQPPLQSAAIDAVALIALPQPRSPLVWENAFPPPAEEAQPLSASLHKNHA